MHGNAHPPAGSRPPHPDAVLDRVLVGIDDTSESVVAAALASVLRAPAGRLALTAVAERHLAGHAGMLAGDADVLCDECRRRGATLVAVGVRPPGRLASVTLGGPDLAALRSAPCSVLVARPGSGPHRPTRVVVAIDRSAASRVSEAVARALAHRLGCELLVVISLVDGVDPEVLRAGRDQALLAPGALVDAVAGAAGPESLVVVTRSAEARRRRDTAERLVSAVCCSVLAVHHDRSSPA